ncbi:hypothetical protein [Trichloromonas sp.]|uniref:hypothetical protein n=1 Tax=Trichloromonas sp. TaxID=3069249 RepID=UPI002A467433|nr:hypothetical protein [Trichloromonas sp.]
MTRFDDTPGMVPYPVIFPNGDYEVFTFSLPRKVGKIKSGTYGFIEAYCVEKNCDCRRNTIFVLNDKGKMLAVIDFGFDPDEPMAGPYLNDLHEQSAEADELLEMFVDLVNGNPAWVKAMYERYRKVRKRIDGRTYKGKPFPKPETVVRTATSPPEIEDEAMAEFYDLLKSMVRGRPSGPSKKSGTGRQMGLFESRPAGPASMSEFLDRYQKVQKDENFTVDHDVQNELRRYLLDHDQAGDELATLLPRLVSQGPKDEERLDAALQLLFDALEILRVELERRRPDAERRMAHWQEALARQVFVVGADDQLCSAVTHILLQARVEILPVLHTASTERMFAEGKETAERFAASPEEAMKTLFQSFTELNLDSPFELFDAFLQVMAFGDAEIQVALCGAMLGAENPMIREAAALMLFHPRAEVREGVARLLASIDGHWFTPEALRRLIIARNWFPETLRGHIDQAIAGARKARVECAPIPRHVTLTVHASGVDGAGAQSFQVIVPSGKGFVSCSMLLKFGVGVADAFLIPLESKRELREFLAVLGREAGGVESSAAYLDARLCQALADGSRRGNVPSHWLVAIAERLGRDPWKAVAFDPYRELAVLRTELKEKDISGQVRQKALESSLDWPSTETFAKSWFEDDDDVDREVTKQLGKKKNRQNPELLIDALLNVVFKKRRGQWLARLVLTTLWLKSATKPPVPWPCMFHVAEALADEKVPLREIPLMAAVASATLGAHMARMADRD